MTATGEIELPRLSGGPVSHRRAVPRLMCRVGLHEWFRINGRYRCLHCPVLRHPE